MLYYSGMAIFAVNVLTASNFADTMVAALDQCQTRQIGDLLFYLGGASTDWIVTCCSVNDTVASLSLFEQSVKWLRSHLFLSFFFSPSFFFSLFFSFRSGRSRREDTNHGWNLNNVSSRNFSRDFQLATYMCIYIYIRLIF